jgi:hypothetical protein
MRGVFLRSKENEIKEMIIERLNVKIFKSVDKNLDS